MPSSYSKVVPKRQSNHQAMPVKAQRRSKSAPRPSTHPPSPLISDGTTTEADLCEWVGWFARFHTDPTELYVPLALRTVDCIVKVKPKPAAADQPARLMRCVREVVKFNGAEGVRWKVITWVPGLPGAQFQPCTSYDDAMILLDAPPVPVFF